MTRAWFLVPLLLFVHLLLLLNTRFTLWPEMVVYPYLLNNGFALYRDIINPYPPLFTHFLAIFTKIFGYNPFSFQILTWILILIIDLLIFFIATKIWGKKLAAFVSSTFFAIFSIPFGVNGLWFDLLQTPFVLISFYYLYRYFKKPQIINLLFFSLLSLSVAFAVKQQVLWIFAWYFFLLVFKFGKKSFSIFFKLPLLLLPIFVFELFYLFIFRQDGNFSDYLFWVFYFPFFKASSMPGYILLPTFRQLLAIFFLFLPFLLLKTKDKFVKALFWGTGGFLILFAYPRFDYFHLVPAISILALALGLIFQNLKSQDFFRRGIFLVSFIFLLVFTIRFLILNWGKEIRFFEKEIFKAAARIHQISKPDDLIYVQNGPDQILPLAGIIPQKPWADEFPWYLEINGLQDKIVASLEKEKPKFVIFKPYEQGLTYQIGAYKPTLIVDWIDSNYQLSAKISQNLWLKTKK